MLSTQHVVPTTVLVLPGSLVALCSTCSTLGKIELCSSAYRQYGLLKTPSVFGVFTYLSNNIIARTSQRSREIVYMKFSVKKINDLLVHE